MSAAGRAELVADLDELFPWTPVGDRAYTRAWGVQCELTEQGKHRSADAVADAAGESLGEDPTRENA